MAATPVSAPAAHRPATVLITLGVLGFLGVTALGGGIALVSGMGAPPVEWLARIPLVDDWLVPGLVLALGFGVGSLVTGYGMLRRPRWAWLGPVERLTRHHWSWLATMLLGAGQVGWIALELAYLPQASALQAMYGPVGLLLLLLPLSAPVRGYLARGASGRPG